MNQPHFWTVRIDDEVKDDDRGFQCRSRQRHPKAGVAMTLNDRQRQQIHDEIERALRERPEATRDELDRRLRVLRSMLADLEDVQDSRDDAGDGVRVAEER